MPNPAPQKLRPRLRFPEFQNAGEWEACELRDVLLEIASGCSLEQNGNSSDYKVSRIETIADNTIDIKRVGYVKKGQDMSRYRLNVGDILLSNINSINHIGKNVLVDQDYQLYHGMNLLRLIVDTGSNDAKFICFLLNTWTTQASIKARANKAVNQASINQTELGRTIIYRPKVDEQEKIADCLSSLDELIGAHGDKLAALQAHKKGLMQQLFPRPGETTPRLRFPEFQNAAAWEEKTLSQLLRGLDAGVSVNSGDRPANGNECGILKTSAVADGIFNPLENKVVLDETELRRLKEPVLYDTIIISRMNTPELVGANAYVKESYEKLFLPDRLWACKPKPETCMQFIAYILGSDKGRGGLSALATGTSGSMKNITKSDVLNLEVLIPTSQEQKKIADFLSSLDELIAAQTEKVTALKAHKKALLQQLFPQANQAQETP